MPAKPARWCSRCKVIHQGSEACPKASNWHQHRARDGGGRGGRPWRRKRERIFNRDHHLCQEHLRRGQYVSVADHGHNAGVLDHIKPLAEGGSDDDTNLQTLCKACADIKTQAEAQRARTRQGGG